MGGPGFSFSATSSSASAFSFGTSRSDPTTSNFGSSATGPLFGSSATGPLFGSSATGPLFGSSATGPLFVSSATGPLFGSSATGPLFALGSTSTPNSAPPIHVFGAAATSSSLFAPNSGSSPSPIIGSTSSTAPSSSSSPAAGFIASTSISPSPADSASAAANASPPPPSSDPTLPSFDLKHLSVESALYPRKAILIEQMFEKYGDITQGSILKSVEAKAAFLHLVAEVVECLGSYEKEGSPDARELEVIQKWTDDAATVGFRVDWLQERIKKVVRVFKYRGKLMRLKELREKVIGAKKAVSEMEVEEVVLKEELDLIKSEMDREEGEAGKESSDRIVIAQSAEHVSITF